MAQIKQIIMIILALSNAVADKEKTECSPGYFGHECDKPCPETCQSPICSSSKGLCKDCKDGYYGIRCNLECPPTCPEKACVRYTASCKYRCSTGWYGKHCDKNCSDCPQGCDKITGRCPEYAEVLPEVAGVAFQLHQSECNVDPQNTEKCLSGCRGGSCDELCPENCRECERYTEKCLVCIPGRYGLYCNHTCPEYCQKTGCDKKGNCNVDDAATISKTVFIAIGVVAAVALIIIAVVAVVCVRRKVLRRRCLKDKASSLGKGDYEASLKLREDEGRAAEGDCHKETTSTPVEGYIHMKKDKTQLKDSGQIVYTGTAVEGNTTTDQNHIVTDI